MNEKEEKKDNNLVFYAGIASMLLLLIGVFSEPSSLLQKTLFFVGAIGLTVVAHLNKQKLLFVLQVIISLGSFLAFVGIDGIVKYLLLLGSSVVGIAYLVKTDNYQKDKFGIICTVGLILIAAGMATNANQSPLYYGLFLGLGGLLVACYSFIDYFYNKNKIAILWFVLNLIFAINPLLMAISVARS
jgi:hypothetical protein